MEGSPLFIPCSYAAAEQWLEITEWQELQKMSHCNTLNVPESDERNQPTNHVTHDEVGIIRVDFQQALSLLSRNINEGFLPERLL